jgi:pterin-4a-carbinolamine dehydratase
MSELQHAHPRVRWHRLRAAWKRNLAPGERSAVWAWSSFTATFCAVRALTHWIKDGHGPSSGGMKLGGHHFHHYNIGIGTLAIIGAIAVRGSDKQRHHPTVALSYGAAVALIVDELALLLDLEDVYWAKEGRTSVDAAVTLIGLGGLMTAGFEFWPAAQRALRPRDSHAR